MVRKQARPAGSHSTGGSRAKAPAEEKTTSLEPEAIGSGTLNSGTPRAPARRVLIIEDNVDGADMLRQALELGGHAVEIAYDGPDGLDKARVFKPEVVLCDIGLPGMDGYNVARAFRADPVLKSVFLVALTGYALPEDLAKALEAGFDQHLAKPPSLDLLEQVLAGAPRGGAPSREAT